ncbi:aminotransferase class IV [Dokdonia pacifica]|uniref:branched-chain-amino-acid transaminase n=1 Tax=Dokdonia pacifica TaxID=1627892 RepID=A0A238YSQ1_9FLAO|nr:aminotransferase class IV [Dokdonia pacifica]GGG10149.1 aminotransferase class IV [Dokdonia pacifica]SNR74306.1 branched-chain amino acid aminotransferase [Dokdonia pacifica]
MINDNGTLVQSNEATLSPMNRGLLYGDGVFETIKAVNSKLLFWEDHYFRLMASMRILRMEIPMEFTPELLEEQLIDTLKASDLSDKPARIRITVYRNEGGAYLPEDRGVGYFIQAKEISNPFYVLSDTPYEVELYKDHYVNADILSTLKTTNKVLHVTGSIFAEDNGYDNCLLINNKKNVVEALQGNIFLVKGTHIKTPPLDDGCLRGIIRKQLLAILPLMNEYTFEEASISPFELQKADELFITNVIKGIRPITKYRKKTYTTTVASALLQKLNVKARLG